MTGLYIAVVIFRIVWMLTILFGTAYVVFGLGYSGWWWLLAVVLMAGSSEVKSTERTTNT